MKLTSIWKLTHDPAGTALVLLNFGDEIEQEPPFAAALGLEIVPLVDGAEPFLRSTGNAAVTVRITRYQTVAAYDAVSADLAAREVMLDTLIAIVASPKKILRVQMEGFTDHYWEFANCVISAPEVTRYLDAPTAQVRSSFTLTCTGLSKKNGTP